MTAAGLSAVSGYYSYRAATAQPIEVVARECEFFTAPLYLSRDSLLTTEDKRKVAALNLTRDQVCKSK